MGYDWILPGGVDPSADPGVETRMFERYTERARRVIFFARYEASQLGSGAIETEHLLLGLIREGKGLTSRLFAKSHLSMDQIRKDVEGRSPYREKVSTTLEIPLSAECKHVLAHAADEAERMSHNYIGTEHILLGLMREERSVAAGILGEKGMRLGGVREDIAALLSEKAAAGKSKETPLLSEFSRDLTEAAGRGALDPLVGRDEELERVIQVLCRRTRNNPVLIGEPGVGKTALVEGLATRIVQGDVPIYLADKRVLALDISLIVPAIHSGVCRLCCTSGASGSSASRSTTNRRRSLWLAGSPGSISSGCTPAKRSSTRRSGRVVATSVSQLGKRSIRSASSCAMPAEAGDPASAASSSASTTSVQRPGSGGPTLVSAASTACSKALPASSLLAFSVSRSL